MPNCIHLVRSGRAGDLITGIGFISSSGKLNFNWRFRSVLASSRAAVTFNSNLSILKRSAEKAEIIAKAYHWDRQ